ncbi:hypothetical protein CC86DRAFT_413095 [Ophiobolus disseminans]|uniref:Jacalin-type lectin domain-containing protein n=1 Tax=Ophiobolus disseminans TaxID=1469910 RepID=A0A6A6ZE58_9PLEO|nr:hypothetical protein CC86DRAFT_413095 [Ophiobolus disseminans]
MALFSGIANAVGDCDLMGPWNNTNVQWTGGPGGVNFCATKWIQGVVITGVEVYASDKAVEAIQFFYSDGTNSPQFGQPDEERKQRIDWDPSTDSLSLVKTWGNGRGKYLGRLYIRTKAGKELDIGKDTSGQTTYEHKVESGILLGAFGLSADSIVNLGLYFLKSKVDKMAVSNVVFKETPEELNKRRQGLETKVVDYADHTNKLANATEEFTFGKTLTRTTSKKWSSAATHTFGLSQAFNVEGKVFGIGFESTTTLQYQYANTQTEESVVEDSVSLTYSASTTLMPGTSVYCQATAMRGVYDGEYTSNVNIWLEDGSTYTFAQEGSMEQVQWSQASSVCQDKPFAPTLELPALPKRGVQFTA